MNHTTKEIQQLLSREALAEEITLSWDEWHNQRDDWLEEKEALRNYVFATDTSHTIETETENEDGGVWNNRTTLPKICQIRDNLHANYMSALFPNDNWMKWEGYTQDDETKDKKNAIQAYMSNKVRESDLRTVCSQLLYDYIDYGIAIGDVIWVNESKVDEQGEEIPGYIGPKAIRRSVNDVVFDPTAISFESSPKITRSIIRMGELKLMQKDNPKRWQESAIKYAEEVRYRIGGYTTDDVKKACGFDVDGFGDLQSYYGSGYVELLEFEGTIHDPNTGELLDDYIITVIDRSKVIRQEPIPAWKRGGHKVFASWRKRPDNLYGMGPLDNLVGMQYRVDHLENASADAWDLLITPMWKVKGQVDEWEFGPNNEVACGEDGDIEPLTKPVEAITADTKIDMYMRLMEEFAGAPKEAMGVRTPGEKTAFEVQSLENAAGRIFQEKITQFEIEILEPLLNNMLEVAVKNMNGTDIIRVMDDDFGVANFMSIKKEDITAKGKLRPIGARHFAYRSQLLQNLTGIANSALWPKVERHFSDMELAKLFEEILQLERFQVVSDNAGMIEQSEAAALGNQLAENNEVLANTPVDEEIG